MRSIISYLSRQPRGVLLPLALGLVALAGLIDYLSPLSVEILYLVPILLGTWARGRAAGVGLSLLSGSMLYGADVLTTPYPNHLVPLWNALVALLIFLLVTYILAAVTDLHHRQLQQERDRATLLARTDALKTSLLHAVSHDVRTPLAAIKASVTSLLDPTVPWEPASRRAFLAGIDEECDRLNHLVSNLLDMSRIDAGMLRLDPDWYALVEVIHVVVRRLRPRLADHPLELAVPADLPFVRLDFSRIDQVLTNLLENAGKYTPPGTPICLAVRTLPGWLEVRVADRGRGVPAAALPHLFAPFSAVRPPGGVPSTGLGLSIVQAIVQLHGGAIRAHNAPDGGLCITFTLPLTAGTAPPQASTASGAPAPVGRARDGR